MYMESSHANNVGCASFINKCLYATKNPAQVINENYRNSITGFPVLCYINDELQGVYNFNLDRYSLNSFGYSEFRTTLSYEISANTETTAGAFNKWTPQTGISEVQWYQDDFKLIYPPSRSGNDDYAEIKRLVEFIADSDDGSIKDTIGEFFNLEYLFRYYLTVVLFGAVDSLGKNMKITTFDGKVWYPQFYDLDTVLGLDNTGYLVNDVDIEYYDPDVFNTATSNLWVKITRIYEKELREEYKKMRETEFKLENIMKYIDGEQIEKIPARYYNIDMQTKYLNYGADYIFMLQGNRRHHTRRWIRERLAYMDSLFQYYPTTLDPEKPEYIVIRANKLGPVYIDISTYIPLYMRIQFSDASDGNIIHRMKRGETRRFEYEMKQGTDANISIYSSEHVKDIGDLTNLRPSSILLSAGKKLTTLKCNDSDLLISVVTDGNELLQSIDLRGNIALGTNAQQTLSVANANYLKYVDIRGTSLTTLIANSNGGNLEEVYLPETTQKIEFVKQPMLHTIDLPYDPENGIECLQLADISIIDCPAVVKTTSNEAVTDIFEPFRNVQILTLRNSLALKEMKFDGFRKLNRITLENMYDLESFNLDNINVIGDSTLLRNITISNCPKITEFTMNVTKPDRCILFAEDSVIDLTSAYTIERVVSNTAIKGLETIVLPKNIKDVLFSRDDEFGGDGISDIKNIWSYASYPYHKSDEYVGIDFESLENVENLDLTTCVYIPKGINVKLHPYTKLVFNAYRDILNLQPILIEGSVDLTDYTGSYISLFKQMDMNHLSIICNKAELAQKDFAYLFAYAKVRDCIDDIMLFTAKMKNATDYSYMFIETDIDRLIPMASTNIYSMDSMYESCRNIINIDNLTISDKCNSAECVFKQCTSLVSANPVNLNASGSLNEFFEGCTSLKTIKLKNIKGNGNIISMYATFRNCEALDSLDISEFHTNGCASMYGTFDNCISLTNIDIKHWDMSKVTNISTMFQGCVGIEELDMSNLDLSSVDTATYFCHMCSNLKKVNFTNTNFINVSTIYCMFRMAVVNEIIGFKIPNTVIQYAECFSNCPLELTPGLEIDAEILSGERGLFSNNRSIKKLSEITIGPNCTNLDLAFVNCTSLLNDIKFPKHIKSAIGTFQNCEVLTNITSNWNTVYTDPTFVATDCYYGCNRIATIDGSPGTIENVPETWGGGGILNSINPATLPDLSNEEPGLLRFTPEGRANLSEDDIVELIEKNYTIA